MSRVIYTLPLLRLEFRDLLDQIGASLPLRSETT